MFSDNPECDCGASTSRVPSRVNLAGAASPGPSRDDMPTTWRGMKNGDRDLVRSWHTKMVEREKLEEKYPELAGDRRPVLAHEGAFATAPVRAGDAIATQLAKETFGASAPASHDKPKGGASAGA
ncbi:hypothetical protein [Flaviflexus huanghaiensis]|uniref:hypothetical protein n=1 Tax=Flaviflexus huanghaiensis TaxID=1111473 RepID=UPI0019D508E9|nr:hypothetical protein [Flaviflexus huanghaiensis]